MKMTLTIKYCINFFTFTMYVYGLGCGGVVVEFTTRSGSVGNLGKKCGKKRKEIWVNFRAICARDYMGDRSAFQYEWHLMTFTY